MQIATDLIDDTIPDVCRVPVGPAAEAAMAGLAADLQGTGVTCNVLVPGGVTNTPLVGEGAGDPTKMLQPEIMVPPLLWLISDAAAGSCPCRPTSTA